MKGLLRYVSILCIGFLVTCATDGGTTRSAAVVDVKVPDSKKKVISVMKFEDRSVKTKDFAPWTMGIPDMIMESLGAIPYFKVVSREHLVNTVMKEQEFQLLGFTDPDSAVKVGNMANAQFIVVGSFSVFNGTLIVNTKVLSVESGQIVVQASARDTVENFYVCENDIAIKIANGMNLYLSPDAQKRLLDQYDTKVVTASLENYRGEEKLETAVVLKKKGDKEKAKELTESAKRDFKKALDHDAGYEKAKKNLSKLVLGAPMML